MIRMLSNRYWLATAKAVVTVGLALGIASPILALGLGKLYVLSSLDEPLVAEIELTSASIQSLDSLAVDLGSPQDFERASIDRDELLRQLEFDILSDRAVPVVRVTTTQPFKEPYLHFLVSAKWPGGNVVKEYTALLDPPLYDAAISANTDLVPLSTPALSVPLNPAPVVDAAQTVALHTDSDVGTVYGPTKDGDTLWNIAARFRASGSGLNLFQIMHALFEENPNAFENNNIHQLKVSETLTLADVAATAHRPLDDATAIYHRHLEQLRNVTPGGLVQTGYALKLTGSTVIPPAVQGTGESVETLTMAAAQTPILEYQGLSNRVQQIENQVHINTERLAVLEKTVAMISTTGPAVVAETTSTVATVGTGALEAAVESVATPAPEPQPSAVDSQLPINQTSADPAPVAETSAQTAATDSATPGVAEVGTITAPTPAPQLTISTAAATDQSAANASLAKAVAQQALTADTAIPAVAVPALTPENPPESRRWSQRVATGFTAVVDGLGTNVMWVVAALALLILTVALLFIRGRRHENVRHVYLDATDDESLSNGNEFDRVTETTVLEDDKMNRRSGSFTSTLKDFEAPGILSNDIDTPDPLMEADLYLTYDHDEQAERVLLKAMEDDPRRLELKQRLLYIYKKRGDVKGFVDMAEQLHKCIRCTESADTELWDKIAAMGRELKLDNPMFVEASVAAGLASDLIAPPGPADVFSGVSANSDTAFDLDLEDPTEGSPADVAEQDILISAPVVDDHDVPGDFPELPQLVIESGPGRAPSDVGLLQEQVTSLQKALTARDNENLMLQERVAWLENQTQDIFSERSDELVLSEDDEGTIGTGSRHSSVDEVETLQHQITSMGKSLADQERENLDLQEHVAQLENQVHSILSQFITQEEDKSVVKKPEASAAKIKKLAG